MGGGAVRHEDPWGPHQTSEEESPRHPRRQDDGLPKAPTFESPETREYASLHNKGDFADVIELRFLRSVDDPGLSEGPNLLASVLISERGRPRKSCDNRSRGLKEGMPVASRSWKRQGDIFSPRTSASHTPA